jgi:DNA (cytosine-5)-methyltransferase 1
MKHLFPYRWELAQGYPAKGINKNNYKVFGTFICGGGSTMGYKLAGFDHLGGVEIDPRVAKVYQLNHRPKHLFVEDIRNFRNRADIPSELFNLDILDGSPPCSSFSMSGNREKDWGKKKVFKEGQAEQVLDDLFFEYIALAKKLQPKIVIAENVKGLIQGNAKLYVKKIFKAFEEAGFIVQLFLLNAASMGVPQKRERVFFICRRKDLNAPNLKLAFSENGIPYGSIRAKNDKDMPFTEYDLNMWSKRQKGDRDYSSICLREKGALSNWNSKFIYDNEVCQTITSTSGSKLISFSEPKHLSNYELKLCGTYPVDYDFQDIEPKYLIGMSVPPVMMAQIANQIKNQWLDNIKNND